MDLQACQRCGSTDLRSPSVGDGGLPGLSDVQWSMVCRRCGARDVPLVFDTQEELLAHEAAVRGWQDDDEAGSLSASPTGADAPPEPSPSDPGRMTFSGRLMVAWGVASGLGAVVLAAVVFVGDSELPTSYRLLAGVAVVLLAIGQALAFIAIGRRMRVLPRG